MDGLNVLNDNFEAANNSFLYYLHEENFFHANSVFRIVQQFIRSIPYPSAR